MLPITRPPRNPSAKPPTMKTKPRIIVTMLAILDRDSQIRSPGACISPTHISHRSPDEYLSKTSKVLALSKNIYPLRTDWELGLFTSDGAAQ